MLSPQKVEQAVHELLAGADIPAPFNLLVPQLLPTVLGNIPQDPQQLDGFLTVLAQKVLDLRSDGAPPLLVLPAAAAAGEVEARA
ncbi:hypothetical protein GKE82_05870 [Conexibacter sp. W3-3-2]|uniref:hypothetical protein n=1 Tax=Conexibacter sp. W3-3-2 TaxID=2675227 RepID=UPI0012B92140|nr:hypothetical protein [Conexibacter sp. W3-3-2]MTD43843.1 hypothetical protein [Conexibacter sp. W3-3-2]